VSLQLLADNKAPTLRSGGGCENRSGSDVELDGTEVEEFGRLFSRTTQKTADLVKENWPAIQRVAAALLNGPALTEDDIDALIAARDNKGEFGVYLVSDGTNQPYKCKIRAPSFAHL
jgi:NADH:ubiquinone oxidoreductase subunit D